MFCDSKNDISLTVTELNKNPLNYAQVSVLADEDILKNVEFDALRIVYIAFLPTVATVLSPEIIEKESDVGGKLGELDTYEIEGGETKGVSCRIWPSSSSLV
ncbi:ATP synthase subunit gamma [Raphanus sativus]|nr:ATP synthase subunit gamma [Raphanus sativus]